MVNSNQPMITALIYLVVTLKVGFMLWSVNIGVDFSDEGWYMLMYKYPKEDAFPVHEYHTVLQPVWHLIPLTVANARLLAYLSQFIALVVFCVGLKHFIDYYLSTSVNYVHFFFIGFSAAFFTWYSRAIAYDELIFFAVYFSSGLVLMSVNRPSKQGAIMNLFSGFIAGFLLFIKLPAFLLLLIFLAVVFILCKRASSLIFTFSGIALSVVAFFLLFEGSPLQWWARYQEGVQLYVSYGYNLTYLLTEVYGFDILVMILTLIAGVITFLLIRKKSTFQTAFLIANGVSIAVVVFINHGVDIAFLTYTAIPNSVFHLATLILVNVAIYLTQMSHISRPELALYVLLLFMPFIAVFGSGSSFIIGVFAHFSSWFILLFLLVRKQHTSLPSSWPITASGGVLLLLFLAQQIFFPYRLNAPLTKATEMLKNTEKLYVTPEKAAFFQHIYTDLHRSGFKSGQPIVALGDLPGLVYLLGGRSPKSSWFLSPPYYDGQNCYCLQHINPNDYANFYLIVAEENMSSYLKDCIANTMGNLTTDYDLLGKYTYEDIRYTLLQRKKRLP